MIEAVLLAPDRSEWFELDIVYLPRVGALGGLSGSQHLYASRADRCVTHGKERERTMHERVRVRMLRVNGLEARGHVELDLDAVAVFPAP